MFSDDASSFYYIPEIIAVVILLRVVTYITAGASKSQTCLVGKTVLITGGNSGIGYQTALILAGRGARIIIADKDDATESIKKIAEETNNNNIVYKRLDLSSFASVREFAKAINREEDRLDILINNAGIAIGNKFTADGLHVVMQTNHFGPFLLTHLLIDLLKKSAPSRIIFVSSFLGFLGNVTIDNINVKQMTYNGYLRSKFMNIVTANILAEKLSGSGVTSNSLYPGCVNTPIFKSLGDQIPTSNMLLYQILLPVIGKTPWQGAQTSIECALSKELENVSGKFFVDCRTFIQPWKAYDKELCAKLWNKSEELVRLEESEKIL